jgi:hypothetical protein
MDGIKMAVVSVMSCDRSEQNVSLRFKEGAEIFISLNYLDRFLGSPSVVSVAGSFLAMSLPVLKTGRIRVSLSNIEIKNTWGFASYPPISFRPD